MKYWLTTDTHFGHEKIKSYCGRPAGYEDKIIRNIAMICKPGDVFIHLGDICWGQDHYWHELLNQGLSDVKRWLIRGNHDKKTMSWYLKHGWSFVGESISLNVFGKQILLSHKPQPIWNHDINIHGHMHNTGHHETINDGKHISFYIEHNYMPVDLRKVIGK